jgi:hypothetical protein
MANYWDTFKPGLLAGQDYWEDFTPEATTETGVVGRVTGQRYQPWEKGYHNIAGLVDDSGQYDAWYDPDPPPETSVPEWGTPEGFENWKNRIALETGNTSSTVGQHLPEGGQDQDTSTSLAGADFDFDKLKSWAGNVDWANVALAGISGNPLMVGMALFNNKIDATLQSVFDLFKPDTDTESGGEPLGGKAAIDAASSGAASGGMGL